ncbi:MAG: DciA family protein [Gemmatimonadaceae bacterium]
MSDGKKRRPEQVAGIIASVLKQAGLAERVDQAGIIPEWTSLVGPQIAAVSEPRMITGDGTLFVSVTTNAWMTELSLMEPELLRSINRVAGRTPVKKIRLQLKR